jgi:hypothetical protein
VALARLASSAAAACVLRRTAHRSPVTTVARVSVEQWETAAVAAWIAGLAPMMRCVAVEASRACALAQLAAQKGAAKRMVERSTAA